LARRSRTPIVQRRLTRALVQLAAFAAYLALFVLAARRSFWGEPLRLPFALDPLVGFAASLSARRIVPWALLGLLTLGLTLALGRVWCGWLCPLGATLDAASAWAKRTGPRPLPDGLRRLKHFLLLTLLALALFGSTALLVLDPLSLLTRTLAVAVWPAANAAFTAAESTLFRVSFLREPLLRLDQALRPTLLPGFQPLFRFNLLIGFLGLGILALESVGSRFWCRSACPLGALLALESKLAGVKRQVNERCIQCGKCERVCPTGTVAGAGSQELGARSQKSGEESGDLESAKALQAPGSKARRVGEATRRARSAPPGSYSSDPGECIMCLDCARVCPTKAIEFPLRAGVAPPRQYDPKRRELLGGLLAGVATASLFRAAGRTGEQRNHVLRPPGVGAGSLRPYTAFLDRCIRCGECMRACPTAGLQPAMFEGGLEGAFAPVLVPRLGYCDYSCNRCGQICPTGAIPMLDLEQKRLWVIGAAYIDQKRCIPWSGDGQCAVCEEMCPLPVKAVWLEDVQVERENGAKFTLKRPHMRRHLCIGCGICETKCPVSAEAAIRVYVTG